MIHPELGCGGLADDDRACLAEHGDSGSVGRRLAAAQRLAAVFGRHVVRIEHVLYADRKAMQWTERPPFRPLFVRQPCLLKRPLGVEISPGPDLRLADGDPVKACRHQFKGADLPLLELGDQGAGGDPVQTLTRHHGQATSSRGLAAEEYAARISCRHRSGAARLQPELAAGRNAVAAGTVAIRS